VLLYAALPKLDHPVEFAISVRAYQILPVSLSNLFALATLWSETVAGILLVVGLFTRKAAGAAFLLLAMFTVAIATVTVRGMVIDCGCFGSDAGSTTGPLLIARNVALLAAAYLVMRYNDGFLGVDAVFRRSPNSRPQPVS
jgi:uncharacterized membrane protein YphA (DoxX/SURF4 family)